MASLTPLERWWVNAWPHRWWIRHSLPRFLYECPDPFRGQVLEVGGGKGWSSRRILETFPQVELTVIDQDHEAIAELERLKDLYGQRLHVHQATIEQLPFDRASFDIAVATQVLHYVPEVIAACRQLLRVLRPGGLLGISEELLFRSSRGRLAALESVLRAERCQLAIKRYRIHCNLWARKPYDTRIEVP